MKKSFTSKFLSCFLCATLFLLSFSGIYVNAASSNIFTYYALTNFGSEDVAYATKVKSDATRMGYTAQTFNLPRASAMFYNLPKDSMAVIHGHGSYRRLQLDQKNGSIEYIYASPTSGQLSFSDYTATHNLTKSKFILFNTCEGGAESGLAYTAWRKGAICTIGFTRTVAGAGQWGQLFFDHADNGITISQARDRANQSYKELHSVVTETSPVSPGNLITFGRATIKLKL